MCFYLYGEGRCENVWSVMCVVGKLCLKCSLNVERCCFGV